VADSKAHPENKSANDKLLADLGSIVNTYKSKFARAAADPSPDDLSQFIDDARCKLVDDAESHLDDYLTQNGKKPHKDLLLKLKDLKGVFDESATPEERAQLFKDNVGDLIERIGGEKARKKYADQILRIYKLFEAHLKGKLKDETKKQLTKEAIKQVKKAAKSWFGNDAPDLVDHILTLRDVIAGSLDDDQKQQVLKDSVSGLAKRLLGEGFLNAPQVRAAMFGFQLGQAFGARLAADLEFIANKELVRDCAVALGASQSTPGAVDYSKPATGIVPKPLWHEGWRCDILPQSIVENYPGALVQATRPDNASAKDKLLWRVTTTGSVVNYDPTFSG
jgi:hypothetical protein